MNKKISDEKKIKSLCNKLPPIRQLAITKYELYCISSFLDRIADFNEITCINDLSYKSAIWESYVYLLYSKGRRGESTDNIFCQHNNDLLYSTFLTRTLKNIAAEAILNEQEIYKMLSLAKSALEAMTTPSCSKKEHVNYMDAFDATENVVSFYSKPTVIADNIIKQLHNFDISFITLGRSTKCAFIRSKHVGNEIKVVVSDGLFEFTSDDSKLSNHINVLITHYISRNVFKKALFMGLAGVAAGAFSWFYNYYLNSNFCITCTFTDLNL
ncbi:MAG: hypothetical protein QS748_03935 [Candidatus Endonucleobacter bathymodioli]|uniref:Uncharacterized protein n=1 Tax=Candidatus Endonucleibacter bathymodioli TaxID=539814 RepID=A0AA90SX70_9GAMM|nr:hypothetical protein [Candidatus Endonucleobacter bathymodioli]